MIVAIDKENGISKNGAIPWDLPSDRKYFRDSVTDGPVLMGWNTYKENGFKPYGKGINFVATRSNNVEDKIRKVEDIDKFLQDFEGELWVVGGGAIYAACMQYTDELFITRVQGFFDCDVFFPPFEVNFKLKNTSAARIENGCEYKIEYWVKLA